VRPDIPDYSIAIKMGRGVLFLQTRQRPTGFVIWAEWGVKTGKLRIRIIVGSGA
jgi:hypothetical protein